MKQDEGPWIEDGHDGPDGFSDPAGSHAPTGSTSPVPSPVWVRPAGAPDFDRAWAELLRVHQLTEARILREACRLRQSFDRGAFPPETDSPQARRPLDAELRLALWRTRVEGELELALVDGVEPHALSRFCAAHPIHRWPAALELARVSIVLENCSSGRGLLHG